MIPSASQMGAPTAWAIRMRCVPGADCAQDSQAAQEVVMPVQRVVKGDELPLNGCAIRASLEQPPGQQHFGSSPRGIDGARGLRFAPKKVEPTHG